MIPPDLRKIVKKPTNPVSRSLPRHGEIFGKEEDPVSRSQEKAIKLKKLQYREQLYKVPLTYEAQGLLGLRKYAEKVYSGWKSAKLLGWKWRSKEAFLAWYQDNPRPGDCELARIDDTDTFNPENVKYVTSEFLTQKRRNKTNGSSSKYWFVDYDPGFTNMPGKWRGRLRINPISEPRSYFAYREFESEKMAAKWVDWVLEQKYGVYCVFNRDLDKELGRQDFDDVPIDLQGSWEF